MAKWLTCVLLFVASNAQANPITSFSVGIPEEITLAIGVPTAIPAAIINTGDLPIDFGCAFIRCGGIQPAAPFGIPNAHRPYLANSEGPSGGTSLRDQFNGVVLDPDDRFDFTLFTFTLVGAPPFPLQPELTLAFMVSGVGGLYAPFFHPAILGGDTTAMGALVFHDGPDPDPFGAPVPESGSVVWLAVAGLLLVRHGVLNGWG